MSFVLPTRVKTVLKRLSKMASKLVPNQYLRNYKLDLAITDAMTLREFVQSLEDLPLSDEDMESIDRGLEQAARGELGEWPDV